MSQTTLSEENIDDKTAAGEGDELDDTLEGAGGEGDEGEGDDESEAFNITLARARGWKPETEWKGDIPQGFIKNPAEFNRHHEQHNSRLRGEVAGLRKDMVELKTVAQQQLDMVRASKDAEIDRLRTDAERRQREAVESADTDKFDEAAKDLRALDSVKKEPPAPAQPAQPGPNTRSADDLPGFREWHQQNAWYGTDKNRTDFAETVAVNRIKAQGLAPEHGRAFYDAIAKEVDAAFGARSAPGGGGRESNTAGGGAGGGAKRESFGSLPASVRADFKKTLVGKFGLYTDDKKGQDEYAKAYFLENPKG